jgi:basic membrane protein A
MQLPLIRKFEAGFRAGLRQVNPAAEVLVAYTGTFDDEKKGVEVGQDLYGRGCDIVFEAAGLDGLGVIKAAQQAGKLVIGVDSDMAHVAPKNVLTSMVKHVDVAVYLAVKDVLDGKFTGGDVVLGLREAGVGLTEVGQLVPAAQREAALAEVEKLRGQIVSGALAVPATLDELAKFAAARP